MRNEDNRNAWKQRNKEGNSCNHNMQTYIINSSCLCYKTNLFVVMVSEKKKLEVVIVVVCLKFSSFIVINSKFSHFKCQMNDEKTMPV